MTTDVAEPGWYHAPGDPADTIRFWDGDQWDRLHRRDPNLLARSTSTSKPRRPVGAQRRLRPWATAAQISLWLLAIAAITATYLYVEFITLEWYEVLFEYDLKLTRFAKAMPVVLMASAVSAAIFLTWFSKAYQNLRLWHQPRYLPLSAVASWLIPCVQIVRSRQMMTELVEYSAAAGTRGPINRMLVTCWWSLWLAGTVVFTLAYFRADQTDTTISTFAPWFLMTTSVASMLLAIVLVQQITNHQDARLRVAIADPEPTVALPAEPDAFTF